MSDPEAALRKRRAIARRHHYVPECYLKGFSVARKKGFQVVVFDRKSGKSFQTATDNVAVERDFNRVQIEGYRPDAFETALAEFEGEVSPALERIIAAKSIQDPEDRSYLFNLIGLLALRNPRVRETIRDFEERATKQIMRLVVETPERWASEVARAQAAGYLKKDAEIDYTKLRKLVVEDGYRVEVPTETHIVQEMHALDALLPHIFNRKWALMKCPDNSGGFVSSDHPVCLMWSDPKRRDRPGYAMPGTEIVFPICSRLAIVGAFELQEGEAKVPEELVAEANGTVLHYAERQAYARDYNFRYTLHDDEAQRKASKLINDRSWTKSSLSFDGSVGED